MKQRMIVGGIIQNEAGKVLLLQMSDNQGVFPGQWGLVGGGMEPDETMYEALAREIKEELNLMVVKAEPWYFDDDQRIKKYANGSEEEVYMVYLLFDCQVDSSPISLNEEWQAYEWVDKSDLANYDLNPPTRLNFERKGWLS